MTAAIHDEKRTPCRRLPVDGTARLAGQVVTIKGLRPDDGAGRGTAEANLRLRYETSLSARGLDVSVLVIERAVAEIDEAASGEQVEYRVELHALLLGKWRQIAPRPASPRD